MIHIKENNFQRDVDYEEEKQNIVFGQWQLCPKCDGNGFVFNTGGAISTSVTNQCDVCQGAKIIQRPIIKP